jgi:hypothetical protein
MPIVDRGENRVVDLKFSQKRGKRRKAVTTHLKTRTNWYQEWWHVL